MNTKCEYLTEAKLGEIIDAWAESTDRVVIRQFSLYNKRLKYDFFVRDKELTEGATVFFVEFDGDTHFRDAQVMERDRRKEIDATEYGFDIDSQLIEKLYVDTDEEETFDYFESINVKFVRIPYFVQLTNETWEYYFEESHPKPEMFPTFNHGFVTTKWFPESFCVGGIERFRKILSDLEESGLESVAKDIRLSVGYKSAYSRISNKNKVTPFLYVFDRIPNSFDLDSIEYFGFDVERIVIISPSKSNNFVTNLKTYGKGDKILLLELSAISCVQEKETFLSEDVCNHLSIICDTLCQHRKEHLERLKEDYDQEYVQYILDVAKITEAHLMFGTELNSASTR